MPPISYYLDDYWDSITDPRTKILPFVSCSLTRIISVIITYLIVIRIVLPSYMKNRKPYQLHKPMLFYNVTMVLANAYFFAEVIRVVDWGRVFLNFDYPDQSDRSPATMHFLNVEWLFWMSRYMDLMDTVFFVLRKKDSQVTFLHLYHHSIVPFLCWLCLKMNPMAPIVFLFGIINTLIHVVMYTYYALASFGPKLQPYLWWKRYLTIIQIIQFAVCGGYGFLLILFQSGYPMGWLLVCVGQNPFFFYMFYSFYKNSYRKKRNAVESNAKVSSSQVIVESVDDVDGKKSK